MAEHVNLYDRAKYYDVIFKRDVSKEIQFVEAAYAKFAGTGRKVQSVLDIACGPGYHARAFADQGTPAFGLDLRGEMLRHGAEDAKKDGTNTELLHWIEADMRTFKLPKPVDAAFVMFDGLDCLLENADLIRHFQAVADNLTPKGIYIVDLSHPKEVSFGHYKRFHYTGNRDGVQVDIHWAINDPKYDLATGVAKNVGLELRVNDHGKEIVVRDYADERLMYPQEINLLAQLSQQLKVVEWFGDFDIHQPLDHSEKSQRMIAVLQKVG